MAAAGDDPGGAPGAKVDPLQSISNLIAALMPDASTALPLQAVLTNPLRGALTAAETRESELALAPSRLPPEGWGELTWEAVVHGLSSDPNTFLVGPCSEHGQDGDDSSNSPALPPRERTGAPQTPQELAEALKGPAVLPEEWVDTAHAALRADPQLVRVRFDLVPKWVDEERFWARYLWKVQLLRATRDVAAARAALAAANYDPRQARGRPRRRNRGVPEWEPAVVDQALAPAAELEEHERWVAGFRAEAMADVLAARDAALSLHTVLHRGGSHRGDLDLLQRGYAQCRDLKQRLACHLATADGQPPGRQALLDPVMVPLLDANAQLRAALSLCHRAGLAAEHGPVLCLAALQRDSGRKRRRVSAPPTNSAPPPPAPEEHADPCPPDPDTGSGPSTPPEGCAEEEEEEEEEEEDEEWEAGGSAHSEANERQPVHLDAASLGAGPSFRSFPAAPSFTDSVAVSPTPQHEHARFASLAYAGGARCNAARDQRSPSLTSTGSAGAALWYAQVLPKEQHWRAEYARPSALVLQAVGRGLRSRRRVARELMERRLRAHMRRRRELLRGPGGFSPEQAVRFHLMILQRCGRGMLGRRAAPVPRRCAAARPPPPIVPPSGDGTLHKPTPVRSPAARRPPHAHNDR